MAAHVQAFPLIQNGQTPPPALKAGPRGPMPPLKGPDLSVTIQCPDCAPLKTQIIEEFGAGDLVCDNCGLVLGDRIVDTRSEWRTFAGDEGDDPSRVGAASNPLDGPETFETSISFRDGNSGISRDLQRAASKASTRVEKSLATSYQEISHLCEKISLGRSIADTAKQLYKRVVDEGILKGKPNDAIIGGCIFIACRMGKSARTFKEIQILTNVPKKMLGFCYKTMERFLQIKQTGNGSVEASLAAHAAAAASSPLGPASPSLSPLPLVQSPASSLPTPAPTPTADPSGLVAISPEAYERARGETETQSISQMLPRFISNLGLSTVPGLQSACNHVLVVSKALGLIDGRNPLTVVGSVLYFVCQLFNVSKTPKEICQVVDTTEGTIRSRFRTMAEKKAYMVKQEWLDSGRARMDRLPEPAARAS